MFPLHQIAHVGVSQSRGLKLFGREVILEEFQPMSSRYLIVTDGQTDRQTDGQTDESDLNTALCTSASRGKNRLLDIICSYSLKRDSPAFVQKSGAILYYLKNCNHFI